MCFRARVFRLNLHAWKVTDLRRRCTARRNVNPVGRRRRKVIGTIKSLTICNFLSIRPRDADVGRSEID